MKIGASFVASSLLLCTLIVQPANAKITSPTAGSTLRGSITIVEDTGGSEDALCGLFGAHADSTISVRRQVDNVIVFTASKGSAGAWSTVWDSVEEPNGSYTITSVAKNRRTSSFCGSSGQTLSTVAITLENFLGFVDDGGAGTIFINPYTKRFQVVMATFDSGVRSDPGMTVNDLPAPGPAPGVEPGLAPWCTEPTGAGFPERMVKEGPQGCVSGLPSPPTPPSEVPPAVDPPGPCSLPGTSGCAGAALAIAYDSAELSLGGVFDTETRTFGAGVVTKMDNNATPMRHAPQP